MLDVHPPQQALTKMQTANHTLKRAVCAWCGADYVVGDVIPWRSLAGEYVDTKMFHPECWGEALRPLQAKMEVAEQLGIHPYQAVVPRKES